MIRLAGTSLDLLFGVLVPTLLDMLSTLLFKSVVNSRASDESLDSLLVRPVLNLAH